MLTPEGLALIVADVAERLRGGRIVVLDGDDDPGEPQRAAAAIESVTTDGGSVTVAATFGADEANMDWRRRQVVTADGVVLDDTTEDHGRKAAGAVWTLSASIELDGDDDGD